MGKREEIIKNHPLLYGEHFHFDVEDGWLPLIAKLSDQVEELLKEFILEDIKPPFACQVKEKYGMLRFYTSVGNDEIYKLIDEAERESRHICEKCGQQGQMRYERWVQCLCIDCYRIKCKERCVE